MPVVQNVSPVTGLPVPDYYIHTQDARFVDTKGRSLLLRGVNLSGATKAPPSYPSQRLDDFWAHAEAGGESFVGRPLNLDDGSADVHLARLRGWGFNMLRYVFTWEALEHEGPGKYDFEFMDYTVRVLRRCKEFGFKVFMDPHQDLWSRFSGGSGAPFWTIAACGLEPRNFTKTEATLLHCEYPSPESPDPATFPAMIWATNYYRLAVFTLFTLFFGGSDFAPKCIIDGVNIQEYLMSHYLTAVGHLADRIRDAGDLLDECVIGWDSMNEPSAGFLGHENLNEFLSDQAMKKGTRPTPAQCLRLGMGIKQEDVEVWTFGAFGPQKSGSVTVDPEGVKAWMRPEDEPNGVHPKWGWKRDPGWKLGTCVWALHDVWDPESGYVLIPDYFEHSPGSLPPTVPGTPVISSGSSAYSVRTDSSSRPTFNFLDDYWRPHFRQYARRVRESHPNAILFVQPPVFTIPPELSYSDLQGRACYSPHYYDGLTLVTRHWNWFNADALGVLRGKYKSPVLAVVIGERAIRKSIQQQLAVFPGDVRASFGTDPEYPTLLGEIGTPFDMDKKRSYGYTDEGKYLGDYSSQQKALDASLNGADGPNALNYTIWTYVPDSTHEWGDSWNLEDLSIWCKDDLRGEGEEHFQKYKAKMESSLNTARRARMVQKPLARFNTGLDMSNTRLLLTREQTREDGQLRGNSAVASIASQSRASLPYSNGIRSMSMASRSTLGFPATDVPSSTESSSEEDPFEHAMYACGAYAETLYHFLSNGARAVGASVRPFPIAIVGTSTNIEFNIAKAEFKLNIKVNAADFKAATTWATIGELEKEGVAPTEIYVPLVHFAEDPFARRYRHSTSTMGSGTSSSAESVIVRQRAKKVAKGRGDRSQPAWTTWAGHDDALGIDVEASEGSRWEVDGQILKWWYPGPGLAPSTEDGKVSESEKIGDDGTVERWIRIKRKGGAIKGIGTREISTEQCQSIWDMCPWW